MRPYGKTRDPGSEESGARIKTMQLRESYYRSEEFI